VGILILKSCS